MKKQVEDTGLELSGIESVNIHDAIKIGSPGRDQYIANYITTLERLGSQNIIDQINPAEMFDRLDSGSNGFILLGLYDAIVKGKNK